MNMYIKEYIYKDENQRHIASKIIQYENGKRTDKIFWKRTDKSIPIPSLYNIPILNQLEERSTIFIVEGEKDVETLKSIGLVATTAKDSGYKFDEPGYLKYFKNQNVVIIPDLDKTGWNYAYTAGNSLFNAQIANSIKILDLKYLLKKIYKNEEEILNYYKGFDITDFFELFTSSQEYSYKKVFCSEIAPVIDNLPEFVPENANYANYANYLNYNSVDQQFIIQSGTEIQNMDLPEIQWLVDGLIPAEGLMRISGEPKGGKSAMMLDLAYCIATGEKFLGEEVKTGIVVYMDLENSEAVIQERLDELNPERKDLSNFIRISPNLDCTEPLPTLMGRNNFLNALEEVICTLEEKPVLIIVDTWIHVKDSENSYKDETKETSLVQKFTKKHNIPIILVNHVMKMTNENPFNSPLGGIGVSGQLDIDMVLTCRYDPISKKPKNHTLHMKGRRIGLKHLRVSMSNFPKWKVVGYEDEIRERESLLSNPYYKAIKAGLEQSKEKVFKVTSSEFKPYLLKASKGLISENIHANTISAQIKKLKYKLEKFGKISYKIQRSTGHTMFHIFSYLEDKNSKVINKEPIIFNKANFNPTL